MPVLKPTDLMVEVRPRRVFSNGHTYHVNSISVNSDGETYLSADDLRINMWHLGITDRSFSILPSSDLFLMSLCWWVQRSSSPLFWMCDSWRGLAFQRFYEIPTRRKSKVFSGLLVNSVKVYLCVLTTNSVARMWKLCYYTTFYVKKENRRDVKQKPTD